MKGESKMPKRGENIHKRKDGRWEGRYKNGTNSFGKTVYSSVYGKTYNETKDKLIKAIACSEKPNMLKTTYTFKEIAKLWKVANKRNFKGSTELKYDNLIEKHIMPFLGNYNISNITSFVLNEYICTKLNTGRIDNKGGLSPSYVKSIMVIIVSIIKFAVDEHLCEPIVLSSCKIQTYKKKIKVLTQDDQVCLENNLLSDTDITKLGILISLRTGLRIGEVCALKWSDIDFVNHIIHIHATVSRVKDKNGKGTKLIIEKPKTKSSNREIPIPSDLYEVLISMKKISVSAFVISDRDTFISPRTYEYRYHKVLKSSNVENVNYHTLRHTFATRCIEKGVDVKSLSEILGHSNISTTLNTYVHSSIEFKKIQLEKLSTLSA